MQISKTLFSNDVRPLPSMKNDLVLLPRYVFVAGLHRSGTSLVARLIAAAEGVGAITGAPVPEQEGVYLQGAIPHTARHGIPGAFAFDPEQHLTEASAFNCREVAWRLSESWDRWFPHDAALRVEKSPVNLLRARLYQQLFPTALFVFVIRHPMVVALATSKWSNEPLPRLMEHWEHAHALLLGDLPYLHNYLIVRYEDLVAEPLLQTMRIGNFIDRPMAPDQTAIEDRNHGYLGNGTNFEPSPVARALGYSKADGVSGEPTLAMHRHCLRAIQDKLMM